MPVLAVGFMKMLKPMTHFGKQKILSENTDVIEGSVVYLFMHYNFGTSHPKS
jgi:hypothetical protein